MEIIVCESPEALADTAAGIFLDRFNRRNKLSCAVSGGTTPADSYRRIGSMPMDWSRVELWWVDERDVMPSDPNSNEGMIRETWLAHAPIPAHQVHTMFKPTGVAEAADAYEREWFARFGDFGGVDLAFLGIGPDGHTASLFPGDEQALKSARLAIATNSPLGIRQRITLTARALVNSEELLFIVTGAEKSKYVNALQTGTGDWPCCRIAKQAEKVTVLCDLPAAGR